MSIYFGIKNLRKVIEHECMNKSCVNPFHLREVTVRVNVMENSRCSAVAKSRQSQCVNGHRFTKKNTGHNGTGVYGGKWRFCKECKKITGKLWARKNYVKR